MIRRYLFKWVMINTDQVLSVVVISKVYSNGQLVELTMAN